MDCEQYQAQFTDFLEATLPEVQWRELEWHLRQCPACAADIKHFRQAVGAMRELEIVEPPRQLLRAISAKVASLAAADAAAQVAQIRPVRRVFSWRAASSLAGACLVLVAIAFAGLHGLRPTAPANPPAVSSPVTPSPAPGATALPVPTPTPVTPPSAATATTPAAVTPAAPKPTPASVGNSASDRSSSVQPHEVSFTKSQAIAETQRLTVPSPSESKGAQSFGPGPTAPLRSRAVGVDIKVTPPAGRQVETWGTVTISITPQGNVGHANVRVVGSDALEVRSEQVYSGPLVAGEAKRVSARVRAHEPGAHALHVIITSDTPVVDTDLPVKIGGYYAGASAGQTHRRFNSVTLAEAVRQVAADGGLSVQVSPTLAGRLITADFSKGLSVRAALRLLAQMADATLTKTDGGYRLDSR